MCYGVICVNCVNRGWFYGYFVIFFVGGNFMIGILFIEDI